MISINAKIKAKKLRLKTTQIKTFFPETTFDPFLKNHLLFPLIPMFRSSLFLSEATMGWTWLTLYCRDKTQTRQNRSHKATTWSKFWRLTSIAGILFTLNIISSHYVICYLHINTISQNYRSNHRVIRFKCFRTGKSSQFFTACSSSTSLCAITRSRELSPLNTENLHSIPFLSIIHVICCRKSRRQILDGVVSPVTKFMILDYKVHTNWKSPYLSKEQEQRKIWKISTLKSVKPFVHVKWFQASV